MPEWIWGEDDRDGFGPHWSAVTFPGEENVKHHTRRNPDSGLYEAATDLTRRQTISFESKEAVEAYYNDWRTMHMPVWEAIKAGEKVTYNVQHMYCWYGSWEYNREGAYEQIKSTCADQGTLLTIRPKPTDPMIKQAWVCWQTEGRPARAGWTHLTSLVPIDTPQNPVSFEAYITHARTCDRLGPNTHRH